MNPRRLLAGTKTGHDPMPIYFRLQAALRERIESGQWPPGAAISPERRLAEEYGASLGTVRKAVLALVDAGYLFRVQGKGTFVAGTRLPREQLRYYRFTGDFGRRELAMRIELIDVGVVPARPEINRRLRIRPEESLVRLRRLLRARTGALARSESFFSHVRFAGLEEFPRARLEKVPLYRAIEDGFGLPTLGNAELFAAAPAGPEEAASLGVAPGHPLLVIEMLSFTYRNRPFEYRISHCLTGGARILRNM